MSCPTGKTYHHSYTNKGEYVPCEDPCKPCGKNAKESANTVESSSPTARLTNKNKAARKEIEEWKENKASLQVQKKGLVNPLNQPLPPLGKNPKSKFNAMFAEAAGIGGSRKKATAKKSKATAKKTRRSRR